jgi:hypothetical protein
MKSAYRPATLAIIICFCSCNHFVYLPKSAKQKYFARPHIQFMMAVVNFRESYGIWPPSLSEMALKSKENRKIIDDFQYQSVDFLIKDQDHLIVYFYGYKKKSYYQDDSQIDLNAFQGRIRFFKWNDKFAWKVKMR